MKLLASLANAAFVIVVLIEASSLHSFDTKDALLLGFLLTYSALNVFVIWQVPSGRGLLAAFFERIRLEQELKIKALRQQLNGK